MPDVLVDERAALIVTPRLRAYTGLVLEQSEVRTFSDLAGWLAGDCFPESPCPLSPADG